MKRGLEEEGPKEKPVDGEAEEAEEAKEVVAMLDKLDSLRKEQLALEHKIIDAREQRLPPPIDRLRKRCEELEMTNYDAILENLSPHLTRLYIGRCSGVMTGRHSYHGWSTCYFVSYQWDEMRISYAYPIPGESGIDWESIFLPDPSGDLITHAYFDCRNCDTETIREDFRPFNFQSLKFQTNAFGRPKATTSRGVDLSSKFGLKPYLLPLYLYQLQDDDDYLYYQAQNIESFKEEVKQ